MKLPSIILASLLLGSATLPALATDTGTVVVAKAGEHALLLWDASPVVSEIVAAKTPRNEALRGIESDAVRIASEHAADLASAKTIGVRVIYTKSGAVSPAYGNATFTGVERVLTITIPTVALKSQSARIVSGVQAGKPPSDVHIDITGALPPG